jgi:predicted  nucleic acid-binding Zn-ribbon protein
VIDDVPASATLQTEAFEQMMQIAPHAGSMPPPLFESLIELSPLRNKDKVLKKLRGEEEGQIPPALKQQMDQMQQAGQELQQTVQELEQKLAQAQAKATEAAAQGPAADLAMREMELKYREKALDDQKQIALLQLQLAENKAANAAQNAQRAEAGMNAAAQEMQRQAEVDEPQLN